jgi:hypothetical protein
MRHGCIRIPKEGGLVEEGGGLHQFGALLAYGFPNIKISYIFLLGRQVAKSNGER